MSRTPKPSCTSPPVPCAKNVSANPSSSSSVSEAFVLEVCFLRQLLQRSRAQHRRAHYHRRLCMALSSIVRYSVSSVPDVLRQCCYRKGKLSSEFSRRCPTNSNGKKAQEEWEISTSEPKGCTPRNVPSTGQPIPPPVDCSESSLLSLFPQQMAWLYQTYHSVIPQLIERLHHAAEAFFVEISRGFFLPFCTVSLACIARLRALALKYGREIVAELVDGTSILNQVLMANTGSFPKWLNKYGSKVEMRSIVEMCRHLTHEDMSPFMEVEESEFNARLAQHKKKMMRTISSASLSNLLETRRDDDADADLIVDVHDVSAEQDEGGKDEDMTLKNPQHNELDVGESVDIHSSHSGEGASDHKEEDVNAKLVADLLLKNQKKKKKEVKDKGKSSKHSSTAPLDTCKRKRGGLDEIMYASPPRNGVEEQDLSLKKKKSKDGKKKNKKNKKKKRGSDVFDSIFGDMC